jgi:hypothetical protein
MNCQCEDFYAETLDAFFDNAHMFHYAYTLLHKTVFAGEFSESSRRAARSDDSEPGEIWHCQFLRAVKSLT